jgi:hypothetical protein
LLAGKLEIVCIELQIQPGRSIWIAGDQMRVLPKHDMYGFPLYFYTIPSDLSKLDKSCL